MFVLSGMMNWPLFYVAYSSGMTSIADYPIPNGIKKRYKEINQNQSNKHFPLRNSFTHLVPFRPVVKPETSLAS